MVGGIPERAIPRKVSLIWVIPAEQTATSPLNTPFIHVALPWRKKTGGGIRAKAMFGPNSQIRKGRVEHLDEQPKKTPRKTRIDQYATSGGGHEETSSRQYITSLPKKKETG